MQRNNIDKLIANKLKDRALKPSPSAWERLSVQLDNEQRKKKKKSMLYLGYAAGIAILICMGILYQVPPNNENVIDTIVLENSLDIKNTKKEPLEEVFITDEAIVQTPKTTLKKKYKGVRNRKFKKYQKEVIAVSSKEAMERVAIDTKEVLNSTPQNTNVLITKTSETNVFTPTIKVNSDDLLFAVTHSPQEVEEYYAKYKVKKEKVLKIIKKELIRSNLNVNPATILAEVEFSLQEDDFKQNFMQKVKLKVSDVIVAIADRNK